jgi:uncharacterized protein (DUF58 family)
MIPRELLKKIRKIEIYTSRMVESQLAGRYNSVFKGRGMAFSEVRPYNPGDDIRTIDWNVSARMNEAHVKLFVEERDRTVMLLVDMSASGMFGTRIQTKSEVAAEVAAMVAFSAIKNDDRVGLILFTDKVEIFVPPKKGKKHVLRVIRELLSYKPSSPATNLSAGLEYLGKVSRRKSVAFLVSDFLAEGWEQALMLAHRRHDVVPVVITDPMEERIPPLGLVMFEDVETGEVFEFDASGPEAREFERRVMELRLAREQTLRRLKIDFVNVRTDRPYVDALVQFFRARERRMQHV